MYNYCTLFDSNYLTRGLAMYESLKQHSSPFHLYIFAFDDRSYKLLKKLDLAYVSVISLQEFEDIELLKVKNERSASEYCWTCTPSIIKYSLEKFELKSCTYLDADLYFFADPSVLIEEMGNDSVLITEHRYTPLYNQSATSGIYCVQFMTFKNDTNGIIVLNWWQHACLDWCYARFEDGKFGDQKYLDDWTMRFEGIHVLHHLGGGVAPWNIQQYDLTNPDFEVIFYHFHNLKFLKNDKIELGNYELNNTTLNLLYRPYIRHLEEIYTCINKYDSGYDYHGTIMPMQDWKVFFREIKRRLKRSYNIYDKKYLIG